MSIFETFIALSLGLASVAVFVSLFAAIVMNVRVGERFREGLGERLEEARLSSMLDGLEVDKAQYLHTESVVDIHQQIRRCNGCGNTAVCDERLSDDEAVSVDGIGFCANESALREMKIRETADMEAGEAPAQAA